MAPRYTPAIYPAFASSRIKRARLAKVRLMRADHAIAKRAAKAKPIVPDVWHEWRVFPPPDPEMPIELKKGGEIMFASPVTSLFLGQLFNIHDVWWREAR